MLGQAKAFSSFSTNDIQQTKAFYEKLGLNVKVEDMMGDMLIMQLNGGATVLIYPKPDHQPASFTVLNFPVQDVEKEVDELTAKGIKFEQYKDLNTDEKGISHQDNFAVAWFKDPAGNILSVVKDM